MPFIASFDIGSSVVKAALVAADGSLRHRRAVGYPPGPLPPGEQDPLDWWRAFGEVLRGWWADGVAAESIRAITFSGQMQDLIAVDRNGEPVRAALLYSDARAAAAAQAAEQTLGGTGEIFRITRNPFNACSVLPKMLHLSLHEPAAWSHAVRVLFGAKDFIVLRLTGRAVVDPTTAATTGLYDLHGQCWAAGWLERLGLDAALLPTLLDAGGRAGNVSAEAAAATGLTAGTVVLCGMGDAAATTLGAGIVDTSQCYAYLGTSGWVARVSEHFNPPGVPLFALPYLHAEQRILIGPVSNVGAVHGWAAGLIDNPDSVGSQAFYAAFEREVVAAPSDPRLLFLPYLASERLPVATQSPQGTITGISTGTTRAQIMRAALEGVSLCLRWAFDVLGAPTPRELVVVGGATRSAAWMQILADAFDTTLDVASDAEFLPCLGAAATAAVALGWCDTASAFVQQRTADPPRRFVADPDGAAMLRHKARALRALQAAIAGLPDNIGRTPFE